MKTKLLLMLTLLTLGLSSFAQGTAFTYQGRLNDGVSPASGSYDLRFALFDAAGGGTQQGNTVTNSATAVSNGLFTVTLDFGNQFPGADRWLEIGVRTNGVGAFTTLSPRQPLTSTPYAVRAANAAIAASASSVAAANITGTIGLGQLPTAVVTNGASGVNIAGTFSGNGAGVTNVNLLSVTSPGIISFATNNLFTLSSSPSAGPFPRSIVALDVNGDGKPDLVSANLDTNELTMVTNNGSGGFALYSSLNMASRPFTVVTAELNGDGKMDLITANSEVNSLLVLTNNGIGGFPLASTYAVGLTPEALAAADVNGDGSVDLISGNRGDNTVSILTNDGSGGFASAATLVMSLRPDCLLAVDVNADNKPDLVSGCSGPGCLGTRFVVLTNSGSGSFPMSFSTNTPVSAIAAADVNNDNKVDLVSVDTISISAMTNKGNGVFAVPPYPTGGVPGSGAFRRMATADVNVDGKIDLIITDYAPGSLIVMTNDGSYHYAIGSGFQIAATNLPVGSLPFGVIATDLNNDGLADLASVNTHNGSGGSLSIYTNSLIFSGSFNGRFFGNGSGLSSLAATNVSGVLGTTNIPNLDASKITSGILNVAQIPNLDAGKITTGTLDTNRIPNLDASKITSGTMALARLPTGIVTNGASGVNLTGTFSGNGAGVTNVNAATLNGLAQSSLWQLGGNNVSGGQFIGSTNNQPVTIKVNGIQGLQISPTANDASHSGIVNIVGGAPVNFITPGIYGAVIAGGGAQNYSGAGYTNSVSSDFGVIGGGRQNTIQPNANYSTIGGGQFNTIQTGAERSTIGGGQQNNIRTNANSSTISGGTGNTIEPNAFGSTIGGGFQNTISGIFATVPGGDLNAAGAFSFAAGHRAKANHTGSFVWADSTDANFDSTANNQFLVRAGGGVGIGKNNPATALDVNGTVTATAFAGSGSGLTGVAPASGSANYIHNQTAVDQAGGFRVNGNGIFNGGSVGIGTTTPGFPLSFPNSLGDKISLYGSSGNHYGFGIQGSQLQIHTASSSDSIVFGYGQSANLTETMRVMGNGNVGIGTTSPANKLQVGSQYVGAAGYGLQVNSAVYGADIQINNSSGIGLFLHNAAGGNPNMLRINNGPGETNIFNVTGNGAVNALGAVTALAFNPTSDRNAKENFQPVSAADVLAKVVSLPVASWNFKADASSRHLGPMAQDFYAAFGLGPDDKHIATVDADGVALAAIQGLNEKLEAKSQKLEAENVELKKQLEEIRAVLQKLAADH